MPDQLTLDDKEHVPGRACTGCDIWKPLSDYPRNWRCHDGHTRRCRECLNAARRIRWARTKIERPDVYEAWVQRARDWAAQNPDKHQIQKRRRHLKARFRISVEDYDYLVDVFDGKCAICGAVPTTRVLCVDHDHINGAIRGLLCDGCNRGLAYFEDNLEGMRRAVRYLERPPVLMPRENLPRADLPKNATPPQPARLPARRNFRKMATQAPSR